MPDNPFSNPAFAALGGQMVQMWQDALDSWWTALLSDSGRLTDLGQRLAEAGGLAAPGSGAGGGGAASAEDLGRVIQALELMQQRIGNLEDQVKDLAGSLGQIVAFLEKQTEAAAVAGETEGEG